MRESILDRLLIEKSLRIVNDSSGSSQLLDQILDSDMGEKISKNVCAKVSIELSNRIDNVIGLLGISKRTFLEIAYIEACDRAEKIMMEEGVHEHLSGEFKEDAA